MSGLSRRAWLLGVGAVLLDAPRRRFWALGGLPGLDTATDVIIPQAGPGEWFRIWVDPAGKIERHLGAAEDVRRLTQHIARMGAWPVRPLAPVGWTAMVRVEPFGRQHGSGYRTSMDDFYQGESLGAPVDA